MKITKIKVQDLYGIHNYEIAFDDSQSIKIIHAPNGYGKTTLLKLISDIVNCKLFEVSIIPFHTFVIEFDDHSSIKVIKDKARKNNKEDEEIVKYILARGNEVKEYTLSGKVSFSSFFDGKISMNFIEKNLGFLKRIAQNTWYDSRQNQKMNYDEIMNNYGDLLFIDNALREMLYQIRDKMPVHFIHANRLVAAYELNEGRALSRRKSLVPQVTVYSKELKEMIGVVLAKSAGLNQELDRTFPIRLIEEMAKKNKSEDLNAEGIHKELQRLENRRLKLQEIGLLAGGSLQSTWKATPLDRQTLKVLKLYIEDSEKKLDIFNELESKVNLMREIINKRFNYKIMQINQEGHFVFELPNKTLLTPDKLSSGEQNELILIFELLFKSPGNSLILIDEPEISLHIAWQQQFLEDMEAISSLTGVKIIIATHSPDIINGRWDLTTGLEEC